jgi:hypothetical protein
MTTQVIQVENINLDWSDWHNWNDLADDHLHKQLGLNPPDRSGVYEARLQRSGEDRLTIGKAVNLYRRVIRGLIKGKLPHSTGKRIKAHEVTQNIEIRWAETDRPSAVEEELHKKYKSSHDGNLPKYTKIT